MKLLLASSSRYRKTLLDRLQLDFETDVPDVDESRLAGESPTALVQRLAHDKAHAVSKRHAESLIIGSDQVAIVGDSVLGKPGNFDNNVEQLTQLSGRAVQFLTGLCLLNSKNGEEQLDVVEFDVVFRALSRAQIEAYVCREKPFDCAGGFRSEGLGISLFESMRGDPTALIGLPLIRLVKMLDGQGVDVLAHAQAR
jgi:septum formation protein